MFSSIWNETSESGNRRSRDCPGETPRNDAISRVRSGWALPEQIFNSPNPVAMNGPPMNVPAPRPVDPRPLDPRPVEMAVAERYEPSNMGSKLPRLTAWPRPIFYSGGPYLPDARRGDPMPHRNCSDTPRVPRPAAA